MFNAFFNVNMNKKNILKYLIKPFLLFLFLIFNFYIILAYSITVLHYKINLDSFIYTTSIPIPKCSSLPDLEKESCDRDMQERINLLASDSYKAVFFSYVESKSAYFIFPKMESMKNFKKTLLENADDLNLRDIKNFDTMYGSSYTYLEKYKKIETYLLPDKQIYIPIFYSFILTLSLFFVMLIVNFLIGKNDKVKKGLKSIYNSCTFYLLNYSFLVFILLISLIFSA